MYKRQKQYKPWIDIIRKEEKYADIKCLIFQKKMRLNNLDNLKDFDLEYLSTTVEPLLEYTPVSSESTAHIFSSFMVENLPTPVSDSNGNIKTVNVNLCRPAGGLAVGLSFSLQRHLGIVDSSDCIGYIGSLNSVFGTYYNILGPLLVGSHAFINEHSNSDFITLKHTISDSRMTTLILGSETIKRYILLVVLEN